MSTAARRRRRRTALVLTALIGVVAAVGLYATAYYMGWLGDDDLTTADGTNITPPAPTLAPAEVTVNVYNATQISGLAGRIANELKDRGFTVGTVSNDPLRETVEAPAALRYGDAGRPYAAVLKTIVNEPGLHPDTRTDTAVDFVLGNGFTELNPVPAGTPNC